MVRAVAIIPARGGSKGIPRKNLRELAGHPLLAWSVAAAEAAETVGRVIVSTDDPEIADVAREYGAETPFVRPAELAADDTRDLPVFQHALGWLAEHEGARPEVVVHLRPTSPLRRAADIDRAVRALAADPAADAVRSVCAPFQNPYKM
jgi:CMP-N-acetylneuraminic acid synthetase